MNISRCLGCLIPCLFLLTSCNQTNGQFQSLNPFGGGAIADVPQYHAICPKQVVLYYGNYKPPRYRVIGFVGAERENIIGFPRSPKQTNAELKRQAASIGANGVIDIIMGDTETTGKAIVVY